jgi:hypothetical protein
MLCRLGPVSLLPAAINETLKILSIRDSDDCDMLKITVEESAVSDGAPAHSAVDVPCLVDRSYKHSTGYSYDRVLFRIGVTHFPAHPLIALYRPVSWW